MDFKNYFKDAGVNLIYSFGDYQLNEIRKREKIKKIPKVGQVITHDSYKFVIEIVDKKRIKQVKLILQKNK